MEKVARIHRGQSRRGLAVKGVHLNPVGAVFQQERYRMTAG